MRKSVLLFVLMLIVIVLTVSPAVAAAKSYTITATAGTGGTISPYGAVSVPSGGIQQFTITPQSEYIVSNVKVDGSSKGAITSYTFTNVLAVHTITVTFVRSYTITATAGTGGTISPTGAVPVALWGSQKFIIMPEPGFKISDVKVDGVSKGAITSYTFTNVLATHTISATFTTSPAILYIITSTAGTGGTISPLGSISVSSGASQKFIITPEPGFKISDVKVDGVSKGAMTSYIFKNVIAPHLISTTFAGLPPLSITSFTPKSGMRGNTVILQIIGTGFYDAKNTAVCLSLSGYPNQSGSITSLTETKIVCTIPLSKELPSGKTWSVVVAGPDGKTVTKPGFTIK
ncbi:MAG: hypothetical protein NTV68_03740 [Methanomicrobiales archaeon]|nr:hypothetical protein [Methanomicrobiales archaeon]